MNFSNFQRSPLKDQDQTRLTIKQQPKHLKHKLKSKSEINIRKKQAFNQLNQQLHDLKSKIDVSKDILTTIYSKAKRKQSLYENQLSKKNLNLHRANKIAQDYKKLYKDGLKLVESCVDKEHNQNLKRNQKLLIPNKLFQLKKNALQKIHQKRKALQQNKDISKSYIRVNNSENSRVIGPKIQVDISQFNISQPKKVTEKSIKDNTQINKMKKSHSAINARSKLPISDKIKKMDLDSKNTVSQSKIQLKNIRPKQELYEIRQKALPTQTRQKISQSEIQINRADDKKTLYQIYKERIQKRQKQQNSQKMSWIVDKLKENIDDLQLIRKKSQIKLQKHSKSKSKQFQPSNNQQKLSKKQIKNPKELQIKRQKSKQKYLEIQKSKLKSINESLI